MKIRDYMTKASYEATNAYKTGDEERLLLFARQAIKNEKVWMIFDEYGCVKQFATAGYFPVYPLYHEETLARDFVEKQSDPNIKIQSINLYEFLDEVIPLLLERRPVAGPYFDGENYLDQDFKEIKKAIHKELIKSSKKSAADRNEILLRFFDGEISEAGVDYIFDRILEERFSLDENETMAYNEGLKLKNIIGFRKFGWPKNCARCYEEIDYDEDWTVVLHESIICSSCNEIIESESGEEELPFDEEILERIQSYGFDPKEMIDTLRKNYDVFGDFEKDKLIIPDWISQNKEEPEVKELIKLYDDTTILTKGNIVYGCMVQAFYELFEDYLLGNEIALPADFIYSTDSYYDENPYELYYLAKKVYDYKNANILPAEIKEVSNYLTKSTNIEFNLKVPSTLTDGRDVFITSMMVQRNHIPLMKLQGKLYPILVNPSETITTTIVPKRYWPLEMVYFSAATDDDFFEDE